MSAVTQDAESHDAQPRMTTAEAGAIVERSIGRLRRFQAGAGFGMSCPGRRKRMKVFTVWVNRIDGASGIRVNSLENAKWLLFLTERFLRFQNV